MSAGSCSNGRADSSHAVVKQQDNTREPSVSMEDTEEQLLVLQPIIYKGTILKLKVTPQKRHLFTVAYRILKNIYDVGATSINCALPDDFKTIDEKNYKRIAEIIKSFNVGAKAFFKIWEGSWNSDLKDWSLPHCTKAVATQICNLAYECAIPKAKDLNKHYESFSSETYGETNLVQMASIIEELELGPNDVFVDLGSGVGQLVFYTSAAIRVKKVVGIELSPFPASIAEEMKYYYESLMSHFNKTHSPFEIHNGDFLDSKFHDLITKEATVIFINNFAFKSELMIKISNKIIAELGQGVRIVTTKPFGCVNREINDRSLNDISSILDIKEMKTMTDAVSWTSNAVPFYLHTVNLRKLEEYFSSRARKPTVSREGSQSLEKEGRKKEGSTDSADSKSSTKSKKEVGMKRTKDDEKRTKSEMKDDIDEEQVFYGRTTRQMWKAQVGEMKKPEAVHSPKWNEPDREYMPPAKKNKKSLEKKKKEKKEDRQSSSSSIPKTPKIPLSSTSSHNGTPSSSKRPSMSSPPHSIKQVPNPYHNNTKTPTVPHQHQNSLNSSGPLQWTNEDDAKTEDIKIKLTETAPPLPLQPPRNEKVRVQYVSSNAPPPVVMHQLPKQPAHNPMPVAVHNTPPMVQPTVIPINQVSDIPNEQRHTFMIPPTDPLFSYVVGTYMEMKTHLRKYQNPDGELIESLNMQIEHERIKKQELERKTEEMTNEVNELQNASTHNLRARLEELQMSEVGNVTDLLGSSKRIVTSHQMLAAQVSNMEAEVIVEESKLRNSLGEQAIIKFNNHFNAGPYDPEDLCMSIIMGQEKTHPNPTDANWNNAPIEMPHQSDSTLVSPTSQARRHRPRQRAATTSRRANSNGERMEQGQDRESEEQQIKEFVQRALKVDNEVKEKERRARGNALAAAEKMPRKGSNATSTAGVVITGTSSTTPTSTNPAQQPTKEELDASLFSSGPLVPS